MTEYPPPYPSPSPGEDPAGQYGNYPSSGNYPQPGGYPPPPGGYPAQPGEYRPRGGRGLAITALVLGLLALLSCWTLFGGVVFGVLGLIFGLIAIVKARRGTAAGGGVAVTGTVLALLGLIGAIVIGVVAGNWVMNHGGTDYKTCVQQANNDQAKLQKCSDDLKSSLQNVPPTTP